MGNVHSTNILIHFSWLYLDFVLKLLTEPMLAALRFPPQVKNGARPLAVFPPFPCNIFRIFRIFNRCARRFASKKLEAQRRHPRNMWEAAKKGERERRGRTDAFSKGREARARARSMVVSFHGRARPRPSKRPLRGLCAAAASFSSPASSQSVGGGGGERSVSETEEPHAGRGLHRCCYCNRTTL